MRDDGRVSCRLCWRSDAREICALASGSKTYEDTWHEGDPIYIAGAPPLGFHALVRRFGNLYARQPPRPREAKLGHGPRGRPYHESDT